MLLNNHIAQLQEVVKKIRNLDDKAFQFLLEIVQEDSNKGVFEDYNKAQLFASMDSVGNFLGFYTSFTIRDKKERGTFVTDEIILFDRGDLYDNITTSLVDNTLKFDNTDPDREKIKKMIGRFGDLIFGLSEENQAEYLQTFVRPRLKKRLTHYLNS